MRQTEKEISEKAHIRYLKNKVHKLARREAWRKANPNIWNERQRKYRRENPEKNRARAEKWYVANKERVLLRLKNKRDILRNEVITAYGNKCACCGETRPTFLTIDHIKGGGSVVRMANGWSGNTIYAILKKLGFPKDHYQLLCYNCNCGRYRNGGICPHKI